MDLTRYYKKFVHHYNLISKPLTNLPKKEAFQWGEEAQKNFETLREAKTKTPVLALPDFSQSFIVETNASNVGMEVVLWQNGTLLLMYLRHLVRRVKSCRFMR